MAPSIDQPEVAWYRLQRGEIAVLLVLLAAVAGLAAWAWFHERAPRDPAQTHTELPPARVNVNTAGETELSALPGIGERKAQRIIESRKQAPIRSLDELAAAAGGIPRKDLDRMAEFVVFTSD
jgi:competence protein ComEA